MNFRLMLFSGLVLTLGTVSAAIIHNDRPAGVNTAAGTALGASQEVSNADLLAMWKATAAVPGSIAWGRPL
jgi:hypothetical protein